MAKLNRRRQASHALEDRQMFAADLYQVFVPLNETGVNDLYEDLLGTQTDSGTFTETPLSGTLNSSLRITVQQDGTLIYYDHAEDGYDADPLVAGVGANPTTIYGDVTELKAGDVIDLSGATYNAGDRITSTAPIVVTRLVDDTGFLGSTEAALVSVNEDANVGESFSLSLLSEGLTDKNGDIILRDSGVFFSTYSASANIYVTDLNGRTGLLTATTLGQQLFYSDSDLQSLAISDIANPGQFLDLTNGWRSIESISADAGERLSVVLGTGNSDLGSSYFFSLVANENLGSNYIVPVPDQAFAADNVLDNNDIVFVVSTDADTQITISSANGAPTVIDLLAGESHSFTDRYGAVSIDSDSSAISVFALQPGGFERVVSNDIYLGNGQYTDRIYPTYYSSGWGFSALPSEFNAPEVQLKTYSGLYYWLSVSEDTTVSVSETANLSVLGYGISPTIEVVRDDVSGLTYHTFKARSNTAYRVSFSPVDSDAVRFSTAGNADISVVVGQANGTDAYGFGDALANSGTVTIHREFYESPDVDNDQDGFVELSEEAVVRTTVINNSSQDILVDITGNFTLVDDFDKNGLTSAYSVTGDSIVSISLYDEAGNIVVVSSSGGDIQLTVSGLSLSALQSTGYNLRDLFAALFPTPAEEDAYELNFASGYRIEISYLASIDPTLEQSIADADYALMGSSSLTYTQSDGSTGSASLTSPLVIEVPETPSFSVDYVTVSESAADPATIYLRLGADPEGNFLSAGTIGTLSTEIKLRSNYVNTSTYEVLFVNGAINPDFTLAGSRGTLSANLAASNLGAGLIALDYTKSQDDYYHSSANLYDQFTAEVRNEYYKYGSAIQQVTITDTGIQGSVSPLDGVAIDPAVDALFEDDTNALTGNILDQYSGLSAYDSGAIKVGYFRYNYRSGDNVLSSGAYVYTPTTRTTLYGTFTVYQNGDYTYSLRPNATQFLADGQTATETITFRVVDSDYNPSNSSRYISSTLNFVIQGNQDIQVVTDQAPFIELLPENGAISDKSYVVQAVSGINQLVIDWDGTADGLNQALLFDEPRLLSIAGVEAVPATDPVTYDVEPDPIIIDTGLGILTISDFQYSENGEEAILVYSYVPKAGAISSPVTDNFAFIITDQNYESLTYDFNLKLIPPITTQGPSLSAEDANGAVMGDYTVEENDVSLGWNADNSDWLGVTVHVEPGQNWRTVSINGVNVVENGRFYDDSDADNIFSLIGTQITGNYGTLTLQGGNKSAGELYFSYSVDGDTDYDSDGDSHDHSAGALLDRFTLLAIDLLNNAATADLDVLVSDTYPISAWDYYGDVDNGVLTEDEPVIEFSSTVSVLANDTFSLDSPNQVIGVKSLDLSGGGLLEFSSPASVFTPREDDGLGVRGLYGTLWMDREGNFTYVLDNSRTATQALTETNPGVEQFAYTLADADADGNNNPTSRSAARLYIYINGAPDPEPVLGESGTNSDIPVPENGGITNQRLNISTTEALATLTVNGIEFTAAELIAASAASPLLISSDCGTFSITGYDPVSGQLVYGFEPRTGVTSEGCVRESLSLTVTDTYGESSSIDIEFALAPPRVSDIPPITTTELLQTDGSETLVRPVYLQQVGTPSVRPVSIELTNPSDYFGGDFEPGPQVDDRRLAPIEPFEPEEYSLIVQRDVPPQLLSVESRVINYIVPSDTFLHTDRQARISLSVTLVDGQPLPEWLEFDPNTATFSGIAPFDVAGEFLIRIVARDNDGRQAETIMRLIVEEPPAEAAVGRTGFSEQLAERSEEDSADAG